MFPQQLEDLYSKPRSAFALKKPEDKLVAASKSAPEKIRITIDGQVHDVSVQKM